jgi:hypothetical protein
MNASVEDLTPPCFAGERQLLSFCFVPSASCREYADLAYPARIRETAFTAARTVMIIMKFFFAAAAVVVLLLLAVVFVVADDDDEKKKKEEERRTVILLCLYLFFEVRHTLSRLAGDTTRCFSLSYTSTLAYACATPVLCLLVVGTRARAPIDV